MATDLEKFFRRGSASQIVARANRAAGQGRPAPKPKKPMGPKSPTRPNPSPLARAVQRVGRTTARAATTTARAATPPPSRARLRASRAPGSRVARDLPRIRQQQRAFFSDIYEEPKRPSADLSRALRAGFDRDAFQAAADSNQGPGPVYRHFLGPLFGAVAAPAYPFGAMAKDMDPMAGVTKGVPAMLRAWGINRIPGVDIGDSEYQVEAGTALRQQGIIPAGKGGAAAAIALDILSNPITYLTFGGAGASAAARAGIKASRRIDLKDVARVLTPAEQAATAARPLAPVRPRPPVPSRPERPWRKSWGPEPTPPRSSRRKSPVSPRDISGRMGPDLPPQVIRGSRARQRTREQAVVRRRRGVQDMPYPVTARGTRAVREHREALAEAARASRRYVSPSQAARAGARAERTGAAVRAAERDVMARMRPMTPRTTPSRTAGGARYGPGPQVGARAELGPRAALPKRVRPGDVPYTSVPAVVKQLDEAKQAARQAVRAKEPDPKQLAHLRGRVKQAKRLVERAVARGSNPRGYEANLRVQINRLDRFMAMNPAPTRQQLVRIGRNLEAMTREAAAVQARVAAQTTAGRRALSTAVRRGPARTKPTARQARTVERMLTGPGSTPLGRAAARARGPYTPMKARRLPVLRARDAKNQRVLERVLEERAPTPRQAKQAGERLERAKQKLRAARVEAYRVTRPPKRTRPEATPEQTRKFREAFTRSKVRRLIDGEMDVTTAMEKGRRATNLGVSFYLPGMAPSGRAVPIFRIPGTAKLRSERMTSLPGGHATDMKNWERTIAQVRDWTVSQFGPNRIVGDAALAAHNYVNYARGRILEWVTRTGRRFKADERKAASHFLEGTVPASKLSPEARKWAQEIAERQERMLDEFIQAGGDVRRLREQYVYHAYKPGEWESVLSVLNRLEWDKYAQVPGFAKRRAFPTIQMAKDAGLDPIEDLAELFAMRASAHHRALAELELARSTAARYGKKIGDIPPGEAKKWVPLHEYAGQVGKEWYVPMDVAMTLKNAAEVPKRLVGRNFMTRGSRRFNRSWKQMALLTSGYHIRNQISDMILVAQAGHEPFSALYRGLRLMGKPARRGQQRLAKGIGRGRSGYTRAEQTELSDIMGVSGHGMIGADIGADAGRVVSAVRRLPRGYQTFSAGRENVMRRGMFSGLVDRQGPVMAARTTKRNIYDYGDVGRAVDFLRKHPGAPFITWPVKNIPRQMMHAAQRPRSFAAMDAINRHLWEQGGMPSGLPVPDWQRERLPTVVGGQWTAFDNPAADLTMVPGFSRDRKFQDRAQDLVSFLSPVLQAPFAAGMGVNPTTGAPFRDRAPGTDADLVFSRLPGIGQLMGRDITMTRDNSGQRVPADSVRGLASWALQGFFPPAGQLSRYGALSGLTNRQAPAVDRGPWADRAGGTVFGVRRSDPRNRRAIENAITEREFSLRDLTTEMNTKVKARREAGLPARKQDTPEYWEIKRVEEEIRELKRLRRGSRR